MKLFLKNIFAIVLIFSSYLALSFPVDTTTINGYEGFHPRLKEAVTLLSDYIKFPSVTGHEIEAGIYFKEYCRKQGLHITTFSEDTGAFNFTASLYPLSLGKPNIVLMHHIDVVEAGDPTYWAKAPFSGEVIKKEVWGRGAIDAKGLGVMQLYALLDMKSKFPGKDLPFNITLLCVSNEESGGTKGAKLVVDYYLKYLNPSVVLGEGGSGFTGVISSNMNAPVFGVSIAEKSSLWLKLDLKYDTYGHGATPAINYANKEMIQSLSNLNNRKFYLKFNKANRMMMRELGKAEGGIRGFFISRSNWSILNPFVKKYIKRDPLLTSLFTNTITVTQLYNPPGPPNSIPSMATAMLDCRLLPDVKKNLFLWQVKKLINEPKIEITVINESPMAEETKPDDFYEYLKSSIKDYYPNSYVVPVLFPATTDNSYFREQKIPTYGLVPSILSIEIVGTVHSTNERISFEALDSGINIYSSFLEKSMSYKEKKFKLPSLEKKNATDL